MDLTLVCFGCGAKLAIEVSRPPQFAFELAGWAQDVGWKGELDFYRHRALVFCSDGCRDKSKTKQGTYRLRPLTKGICLIEKGQ